MRQHDCKRMQVFQLPVICAHSSRLCFEIARAPKMLPVKQMKKQFFVFHLTNFSPALRRAALYRYLTFQQHVSQVIIRYLQTHTCITKNCAYAHMLHTCERMSLPACKKPYMYVSVARRTKISINVYEQHMLLPQTVWYALGCRVVRISCDYLRLMIQLGEYYEYKCYFTKVISAELNILQFLCLHHSQGLIMRSVFIYVIFGIILKLTATNRNQYIVYIYSFVCKKIF